MKDDKEKISIADSPEDQAILDAVDAGVNDPRELAKLAGMKKVADVYVALDKLSLRKQFHAALARADIDMDFIVTKLKKLCETTDQDVQLRALGAMMKALGLDKYEVDDTGGKSWEDTILLEAQKSKDGVVAIESGDEPGKYEVKQPTLPDSLRKIKEDEKIEGKSLYESSSSSDKKVSEVPTK